jgi:hypothetical protein
VELTVDVVGRTEEGASLTVRAVVVSGKELTVDELVLWFGSGVDGMGVVAGDLKSHPQRILDDWQIHRPGRQELDAPTLDRQRLSPLEPGH